MNSFPEQRIYTQKIVREETDQLCENFDEEVENDEVYAKVSNKKIALIKATNYGLV